MINWIGQIRFPKRNPHSFTVCLVGLAIQMLLYALKSLAWPISFAFVCSIFSHTKQNTIERTQQWNNTFRFAFIHSHLLTSLACMLCLQQKKSTEWIFEREKTTTPSLARNLIRKRFFSLSPQQQHKKEQNYVNVVFVQRCFCDWLI